MFHNKNIYLFIFILCVVTISIYVYSYYLGEFTMLSINYLGEKNFKLNEDYYLGYDFKWKGIVKPKIEQIKLGRKDGTILSEDDKYIVVKNYIDNYKHTGSLNSDHYYESLEYNLINYSKSENFKIKDETITLVLNPKKKSENYEDNINQIIIHYKFLGFEKKQVFEIEGFLK